jgi:hypothetical protein
MTYHGNLANEGLSLLFKICLLASRNHLGCGTLVGRHSRRKINTKVKYEGLGSPTRPTRADEFNNGGAYRSGGVITGMQRNALTKTHSMYYELCVRGNNTCI